MSGHVKYERSRSPGEIEGESASHDDHRIMHISILNTRLRDPECVSLQDKLSWYPPMIIHPLNNMTYRPVKRKKASQLAVMLATPSHAIESVYVHTMNDVFHAMQVTFCIF